MTYGTGHLVVMLIEARVSLFCIALHTFSPYCSGSRALLYSHEILGLRTGLLPMDSET
jgi:hypothetical protein